jgi:hypothetical protein
MAKQAESDTYTIAGKHPACAVCGTASPFMVASTKFRGTGIVWFCFKHALTRDDNQEDNP